MKAKLTIYCLFTVFVAGLLAPLQAATVFPYRSSWKYFVGTQEASSPIDAWRAIGFNDGSWSTGDAPLGYANPPNDTLGLEATIQTAVPLGTLSVFCRKEFVLTNPTNLSELTLTVRHDDGFVAWINGTEIGRFNVAPGPVAYNTPGTDHEVSGSEAVISLTANLTGLLVPGNNLLAIQVLNSGSGSSDLFIDAALASSSDVQPPVVLSTDPPAGATVTGLSFIGIVFDESVTGVDASDLLINGVAATNLLVVSPREYQFRFPQPATGAVQVAWAPNHGITDLAVFPNAFAGGNWTYTLDPNAIPSAAIISEFMTDNENGIQDEDGSRSDWIEIYNPGNIDVNLNGWFLADKATNLTAWRLPSVFLGANKYLLVWASSKNRTNPAAPLHTNFKLAKEGGFLALVDPNTNVVSVFDPYPSQRSDVSYGRDRVDPNLVGYFTTPTPGAQNTGGGPGFAPDPVFSVASGIYTNASLTVTITAPLGTIRYTLNGTLPATNSPVYTGPITFGTNLMLKARVFPPATTNLLPSTVVAKHYLFLDSASSGFSSYLPLLIIDTQGRAIPQDVPPGGTRVEGTFSVIDTFRGRSSPRFTPDFQGSAGFEIYGQTSAGFAKRPLRVEIHDAVGNDLDVPLLGMPADADWRLRNPYNDKTLLNDYLGYEAWEKMGHYSVRRRLVEVFVDTGGGRVVYPTDYYGVMVLFETIKVSNDRLDIGTLSPYATNEPAVTGGYVFKRDKDSAGDLNFTSPGGAGFSAIPLKLHEPKPNELRYAQGVTTSFPGAGYTPAGTNQLTYLRNFLGTMERAMYTNTWLTQTGTNHYTNYLDPERFADQMLHVEFTKQIDGYRLSDYFYKDRLGRVGPGPVWDWNLAYGNANYLTGGRTNGWYYELAGETDHPWARRLITGSSSGTTSTGDPNFVQLIADRWAMFRTNVLNGPNVLKEIDELSTLLREAAARDLYGKYRSSLIGVYTWPNPDGGVATAGSTGSADGRDVDFVRPTNYLGAIETVAPATAASSIIGQMKKWVLGRYLWMDSQFTKAPTFSLSDGEVATGTTVTLTPPAGAVLYYTLDGTDPRAPGGMVISGALSNNGPVVLTINSNVHITARAKAAGAWKNTFSGPNSGTFYTMIPPLRITELMYHPAPPPAGNTNDADNFEYIEVKNVGATPLNLQRFRLTDGVQFDFPNMLLPAGASGVIVADIAAFQSRYGSGPTIIGQYTGRLENGGERIVLEGPAREPIHDFQYSDEWYPITDGFGFSLVIVDENAPLSTWGLKTSWRPSGALNGSPGLGDGTAPAFPQVVINEALTHSDPAPPYDTIELLNLSGADANIGGWFLTDDFRTPRKFRIPNGTTISANGYLTFDETAFNVGGGGNIAFALSSMGDEVYLFSADAVGNLTGYFHGFDFGAQFNGVTFGRHVISTGADHFVAQTIPTLGGGNSGPRVGPIVVSEINYRPVDVPANGSLWNNTEDEYIELHNSSGASVPLYDPANPANTWRLRDAVNYTFPTNVMIPPGGFLLVASIDAGNPAALAAFRTRIGASASVPVFGPFSGRLDNSGDSVELVRPDTPNTNGVVPYVLMDKVRYSNIAPWPVAADGIGPALQRLDTTAYGNDPINWTAAARTPGALFLGGEGPTVTQQPTNKTIVAYMSASFTVAATGPAPINYQWRFNGQIIPGATSATLVLSNVQPSQAGQYQAVVFNNANSVISSDATLTVLIPATITQQPQSQRVRAGTNVTFAVGASSSTAISYQWFFNGAPLSGATSSSLTLNNITNIHDGTYTVRLTDAVGPVFSQPATLTVLINPFMIQPMPPLNLTVASGDFVTLSAQTIGTIPMLYRWRRISPSGSGTIVTNFFLDTRSHFYTFRETNTAGTFIYTLILTNEAYTLANIAVTNAFVTILADTDGDRIPDDYESSHGLNPTDALDATMDLDGDGMSNRNEYIAGTDPADPTSYLKVQEISAMSGAVIEFNAVSNRTYTVEYKDGIATPLWTRLADVPARGTNWPATVIDASPSSNRYYHLVTPKQP